MTDGRTNRRSYSKNMSINELVLTLWIWNFLDCCLIYFVRRHFLFANPHQTTPLPSPTKKLFILKTWTNHEFVMCRWHNNSFSFLFGNLHSTTEFCIYKKNSNNENSLKMLSRRFVVTWRTRNQDKQRYYIFSIE